MDKTTLLERINQKQNQIVKIERSLAKNLAACSAEERDIINRFLETGDRTEYREYLKHNGLCWGGDAWARANDLYDARLTLQKYQNMLAAMEERDSVEKIGVIWQFLLEYKSLVINWLKDNAEMKIRYYEEEHKYCDMYNSRKYSSDELNDQWRIVKKYKNEIHPLTERFYSVRNGWNMEGLNKVLDKDIENRYFKLINQVTKYCGEIINAEGLRITKGELNGIVIGTEGKAKIETIGAGGYNIQCFHYRTLIKEVK